MTPSIMAVAAHPGDALFTMGAAVAEQTHRGGRGLFLSLTLGEKGSPAIPPEKYGAMQREATLRAAEMLGAEAAFFDYPDGELPLTDEVSFKVCDWIRKFKPGIVITHWSGSWHKDHQAAHAVARDGIFYAALAAFRRSLPAHPVGKLYYAENWEDATGFQPDTYLDITSVVEKWLAACAVYPMWRGENGFRYNDYYRALAVARGCLGGFAQAVALMSPADQREERLHSL